MGALWNNRLWVWACFWLKPALLLAYLVCDYRTVAERVVSLGLSAELGLFIALYGVMAAGLLGGAYIRTTLVRICLALLLFAGSVALHSYEWATAHVLDYNAFETMLASRGDAGDALAQHGAALWRAVFAGLLLLLALILPPMLPTHGPRKALRFAPLAPLGAFMLLTALLYMRGGEGARALPGALVPLAHATIKAGVSLAEGGAARQPVQLVRSGAKPAHDIILIIDESIAGRYLDINAPEGARSGLGDPREGLGIHNFGIAASITNCSAGSNQTLRYGGTRENYRDIARTGPSIWAYARKAGMRTVYMDAQRTDGALQNLMTPDEKSEIDEFIQTVGVPVLHRDMELARLLRARIENGVAELIVVNKVGGHFPVADKFPDDYAVHQPILPRGRMTDIAEMGPVHVRFTADADYWRRYRNAYRNTLAWNVGTFFDRLLEGVDPEQAVIFYTSDHGQDLHERGQEGKASHCVNDPNPEEGAVPLVLLDSDKHPKMGWADAARRNHDRSSHFRIFPTLLELMGYEQAQIAPVYGPSLLATEPDPMTFTINYFAALGRQPSWHHIDADKLIRPLGSDGLDAEKRDPR